MLINELWKDPLLYRECELLQHSGGLHAFMADIIDSKINNEKIITNNTYPMDKQNQNFTGKHKILRGESWFFNSRERK